MPLIKYDKKIHNLRKGGEKNPKPHSRTEKPQKKNTSREIPSVN